MSQPTGGLQPGALLDNRYEVLRPLGAGGQAATFLVRDTRLGRQCVAKASSLQGTAHEQQFKAEAVTLAALNHPNLPEVYDHFYHDDRPYLVMQYIEGDTLRDLQAGRAAPFDADQVLRWAGALLNALEYLHGQGPPIIHRDIKPANVCITPESRAVLLDFGIARRLDRTTTRTGAQLHSLHYSPIEQYPTHALASYSSLQQYLNELRAAGIHTGPYSDLYSLGATLYYALTLLDPPDACMRQLGEQPLPITELNPEAPPFLVDAITRAMILDPRQRCQTAADFKAMLQPESVEPVPRTLPRKSPRPLPKGDILALDHELVYIPAGQYLLGGDDTELKAACRPQHPVQLDPFCLARRPVTHADYQLFIQDSPSQPVPHSPMRFAQRYNWDEQSRTYPRGLEDHPVVLITWAEAQAYCHWLTAVSGYCCRLPTEVEWEVAACWEPEAARPRRYPWGDDFEGDWANVDAHGALRLTTSPVGEYSPEGDSPYGLIDMAGNVWEWTASLYQPYPYDAGDGREDPEAAGDRIVRGGAYDEAPLPARCAWRHAVPPDLRAANIGFRVACDA